MQFELVTVPFGDGLLHGMVHGSGNALAIHLHGTWGNFYENPFVAGLAPIYADHNIRYAAINLPSHDSGSIDESLDDSLLALEVWVNELASPGTPVILQGHSLGALKIISAWQTHRSLVDRVKAVALFSPFDAVAFNGGKTAQEVENNRRVVEEQVRKLGPDTFVPKEVFEYWPLSGSMYLSITQSGGEWDVFPSRNGTHNDALASINCPALVVLGGDDFASFPSPSVVYEAVTNHQKYLIDGAPHNFAGKEVELGARVNEFLVGLSL